MFRFNLIGLGMTVVSFAIGYVLRLVVGQPNGQMAQAVVAGILMFIADIAYRFRSKNSERRMKQWLSPKNGGWLAFPVWVMGILFVIYGFVEL